jgi:hypothetical protein
MPASHAPARLFLVLATAWVAVWMAVLLVGCSGGEAPPAPPAIAPLAGTLAETGLFADGSSGAVAQGVLPFSPQYPLWTDGATKRRWIRLPEGAAIDASDPDAWRFPVGTKIWKEFAFGRPVETRLIERLADGTWRFAAYVWSADGREAVLAPETGLKRAKEIRPGIHHDVPGRMDCLACHGGRRDPVLGFSALQLSTDRDPLAPHAETPGPDAVNLATLKARGLLTGQPRGDIGTAPRIAARSPRERAALGYLHANCASCHATGGPLADLGLALDVRLGAGTTSTAFATALGNAARFRLPGHSTETALRLAAGDPASSLIYRRASSREPALQMPPLGTKTPDAEALALIEAWIREDLASPAHPPLPSEE